jgi:hypothetical protein
MIRLTRSSLFDTSSEEERARLRSNFHEGVLHLPGFLEPEISSELMRRLEEPGARVGADGRMEWHPLDSVLCFLFNEPRLFALVSSLSGCGAVAGFTGKMRRVEPGKGGIAWHNDMHPTQKRLVALTLNLSPAPYEGGDLQLAHAGDGAIFCQRGNPAAGDVLLFKIGPEYRHRSTPVLGRNPKWIFSGWFCAEAV